MFWWIAQTHTVCVPEAPAKMHHFGFKEQNLEKPILTSGYLTFCLSFVTLVDIETVWHLIGETPTELKNPDTSEQFSSKNKDF